MHYSAIMHSSLKVSLVLMGITVFHLGVTRGTETKWLCIFGINALIRFYQLQSRHYDVDFETLETCLFVIVSSQVSIRYLSRTLRRGD